MFFDILLIPFDSYWHKKYVAMERERKRSESCLRYSESIREDQESDLAQLSEKDKLQSRAILAFNEEREKTAELIDTLQRQLSEYQQRYASSERERRKVSDKLEDARRTLAQEFDNRDSLIGDIEELTKQLSEYKELCRHLRSDLDAAGDKLTARTAELDELRAEYEALTCVEGAGAVGCDV